MISYTELFDSGEVTASGIVDYLFQEFNINGSDGIYDEKDFVLDLALLLDKWQATGERP